jgi:aldose 1-epimerase
VYGPWAAVALEQQGYVDAINTPEWNVDQICEFLKLLLRLVEN